MHLCKSPDLIEVEEEKKACNPDEIIDGRPKWSKIMQNRKGNPKKKKLPLRQNSVKQLYVQKYTMCVKLHTVCEITPCV